MTRAALQARAFECCCDFHLWPEEIASHLARWAAEYGRMEATGEPVPAPPKGWTLLPFRQVIDGPHREFYEGAGWLYPRQGPSTVTPIFSKPHGRTRAYAVPNPADV